MRKAKSDKEIAMRENEALSEELDLTEKQKAFCREYIFDWNATRAYLNAYPDVKDADVAKASASRLLTNVNVKAYIEEIQKDLERLAGLSRLRVINEHMKLAFSSIAHLHNSWIERKEFESLTDEQKACIAEIDTKTKIEYEYNYDSREKEPVKVEYVRIKLYDKQKALDSISKMLGYDAPSKIEVGVISQLPDINLE